MGANKEKLRAFKKGIDATLKDVFALEDTFIELVKGAPPTIWDVLLRKSQQVKITALLVTARGLAEKLAGSLREIAQQAQALLDAKSATPVFKERIDEGVEMIQLALNELSHRDQDSLTPKRLQRMADFVYSGSKSFKAVSDQIEDMLKMK